MMGVREDEGLGEALIQKLEPRGMEEPSEAWLRGTIRVHGEVKAFETYDNLSNESPVKFGVLLVDRERDFRVRVDDGRSPRRRQPKHINTLRGFFSRGYPRDRDSRIMAEWR